MRYNVVCLLAAICLLPTSVFGEDISLSWSNPTETFTMTTAGAYTNPAGTKIYMEVAEIADPVATSYVLPDMKPGTYRFVAVSYDTEGVASPVSTEAEKVVTSFKALAGATVHQIVTINNAIWLLPIGTVDADTECITEQSVNGMYAVPVDAITWSPGSTARPPLVVANCQ